jgi:hypothetical protein
LALSLAAENQRTAPSFASPPATVQLQRPRQTARSHKRTVAPNSTRPARWLDGAGHREGLTRATKMTEPPTEGASMRAWLFAAVFVLSVLCRPSAADSTGTGFTFCGSSPSPPQCANAPETFSDDARTNACQDEISRYVATSIAYRSCMMQETQRAVLRMNSTVDRFKCGAKLKRPCP